MTTHKPQLTFGVEFELTGFWNQKPLISQIETIVDNTDDEKLGGDAILTFSMTPKVNADGWNAKLIDASIVDYQFNPIRSIDVDSNGNFLPPWKSDYQWDIKALRSFPHVENTVLHQAKILLEENHLQGWVAKEEAELTEAGLSAVELASPILEMDDFDSIEKVCEIFSDITTADETCGLHIHIGQYHYGFEYGHIKRLVETWMEIEPKIWNYPVYQVMGDQNHPLTSVADLNEISEINNLDELQDTVNPNWSRNYLINLRSLESYRTVEFRGFKSTLDFEIVRQIVKFCEQRIIDSF